VSVVALIYPFFLWQLAWVLGGPATIGGLPGFDETMSSGRRWVGLALLWAAIFVFAVFLRNLDSLNNRFSRALLRLRDHSRLLGFIPQSWVRAVGMSVAVGAGIGVVAVGTGVAVGASAGAVVAGGMVVASGVVVADGMVVVAGVAVGAVAAGVMGDAGVAIVYVTMLILVPAANAALDHFSVQVSRRLLTDLVDRRGAGWQWLMILGHVVADIVAAGAFFAILAVSLPALLQLANRGFDALGWPLVEWSVYLDAARKDPFGAGLLVTGMLLTTLIPTILHLLAAGVALALPWIGGATIDRLADKPSPTLLDRMGFVGLIFLSVLLSWAALVVVSVTLWEAVAAFVGPLGQSLADLAYAAGRMVGGPGAPGP
jgi:hypothetical protein